MSENKSYYAIIPASVRYDNNLKPNAKLLYGEITALSNEKGYCWAGNDYFANLYGVSKETISRWISQLHKNGHILVEISNKEITNKKRKIYIDQLTLESRGIDKKVKGSCQKGQGGIDEKVKYNNTVNNTSNNMAIDDFFNKAWLMYRRKEGKGSISKTQKTKLYKLGDEFIRCIERYNKKLDKEGTEIKYMQYGSKFFKTGYIDYLDENYNDQPEKSQYADLTGAGGGEW